MYRVGNLENRVKQVEKENEELKKEVARLEEIAKSSTKIAVATGQLQQQQAAERAEYERRTKEAEFQCGLERQEKEKWIAEVKTR